MSLFPPATDTPGLVRTDAATTSRKAAEAVWPTSGTKRAAVLAEITRAGSAGATDEEISAALEMSPNTERPRRVELVRSGWVVDSGKVRPTGSGCDSTVWIVSGMARMEMARRAS